MRWCLTLCLGMTTSVTTLGIDEAQQNQGSAHQSAKAGANTESMSTKTPLLCGGYCVWDDKSGSDESAVDPGDLLRAIDNSAAWIRAVLREEHLPGELEEHIVGVVDGIEGYDVTRVAFESEGLQVVVTQDSRRIVVVVRPVRAGASRTSDAHVYLREMLEKLFKHAARVIFFSRIEEAPFGVRMIREKSVYDENGIPLSHERRKRISDLSQSERSEAFNRLTRIHEKRPLEIDPSLPRQSIGGSINYWWGLVHARTDGRLVVFSAPKSNGGPVETMDSPDWFRKEKLPRPGPRNLRKPYRPSSLWPPKEDNPQGTNP